MEAELPSRKPQWATHKKRTSGSGEDVSVGKFNERPLVSVIMPVYNHRSFVVEAMQSVYGQTYRPVELVIVDDGSSDGSAEVIRRFMAASPPPDGISVSFRSRRNRGAHATINEGLDCARGDYLAIINSDDLYVSERLQKCVDAARYHRALLVFSYVEPIDQDGWRLNLDHPWCGWYNKLVMQELDRAPSLSFLLISNNIAVSTGNLFFDRRLLEEIGHFRPYHYTHDIDFVLRSCLLKEPVLIREKLYKYRIHQSNTIAPISQQTDEEYGSIVRDYLNSSLTKLKNPLAPDFTNWPNAMGKLEGVEASRLIKALASFIENPEASESCVPTPLEHELEKPTMATLSNGKKVTIVSHELSLTGAPMIAYELAKLLIRVGFEVEVISQKDGPLINEFAKAGIPVRIWSRQKAKSKWKWKWKPLRRTLKRVRRAAKYFFRPTRGFARSLKRRGFVRSLKSVLNPLLNSPRRSSAVQSTLILNSFASYPVAFEMLPRWKGPKFWYIHETYDPDILLGNSANRSRLERYKSKIHFLYGSNATREVWSREGFDGRVCYWSGLPASLANWKKSGTGRNQRNARRLRILSVGTSGPRKGTRVLIEAFAYGCRNELIPPETELVIVAVLSPTHNPQTRDFILRTLSPDIRGRVRLVGVVQPTALYSYYAEADIYVQSSNMECLPIATLTAMAYGLPIVTTDVDGCREAIVNGVSGITVPPRQIEMLASAIGEILSSPSKAKSFGEAARKRFVEKFSLEVTGKVLTELLISPKVSKVVSGIVADSALRPIISLNAEGP